MTSHRDSREFVIEQILHALNGLEYGSVNIVVHDGQIVQIDRLEKRRFGAATTAKPVRPAQKALGK
ncbi:hypothetical protein GCM10025857_26060 [Alicyclobacillus contaminans]|uniref:YezD family protein n=1 Tax=Alicyclobacillus contaminans TaxID=392016 RepID=UPI0003F7CCE8|nr:YezD family protein [Alicyclobacillus contaminans]GMA51249.1 hypothetical protein GCM10025857_26060 [Alicyclobacillus contaminans]